VLVIELDIGIMSSSECVGLRNTYADKRSCWCEGRDSDGRHSNNGGSELHVVV